MADRDARQGAKPHDSARTKPAREPKRPPDMTAEQATWRLEQDGDVREFGIDQPDALRPTARGGVSASQMLALQRTVGNRALVQRLRATVQRVPVTVSTSETLYNQTSASGQATARAYGGPKTYQITRQGDSGVTVSVRIKYLNQNRNTVAPPPGAPSGAPRLGQLLGSPTEIPSGDPRRAWATGMAAQAVAHWNGRLVFVGEEWNLTEENTEKRLPVTFRAVPVFDIDGEADSQVIVHPAATVGGTTGNPIDAGNYYMAKNSAYPANADIIYAHEYGHLIGITDEYSQSNEQMNALMHEAAPGGAASAMAALDQQTVERMALAAMRKPLYSQLRSAMPTVAAAMAAQGDLVKTKMAAAAREAVVDPAVTSQLEAQLTAESDAELDSSVPRVVAFQTTRNFSNITRAAEGVEAAFSLAALQSQIGGAYWAALLAPMGETVAVAGLGDVSINVKSSVAGSLSSGGASGNATGLATSTVGPTPAAAGGGGAPGLPAVAPPESLVGQISAIPATWAAAGSSLESGVTPAAFSTKMQAALSAAASLAAAPPPGALPAPAIGRHRELYVRAHELVNNAATTAATQVATDLVAASIDPVLQSSVSDFQAAIAGAVQNVMTMGPHELAAAASPDPNMKEVVLAMKAILDQNKAATAGGGRNPGAGAAAQDVTYSYQGLMGSNATTALRADQFAPMLAQFNSELKNLFERSNFTAETS